MKKIILIIIVCLPIFSFSQTKWLKKAQVITTKIDRSITNFIIYDTKDIEIIDFNDHLLTDNFSIIFNKLDYKNDTLYSYMNIGGDSCYSGFRNSKLKRVNVKIFNEYKVIAGYKCQKGLYPSRKSPKDNIIIWFTTAPAFKDFFYNRNINIEGVVLEIESENDIRTITEITILSEEPDIVKVIALIKPCDIKVPNEMKPIIDNTIKNKNDEINKTNK